MYNPSLHFHFIGIGGSGMSGIAEILLALGFHVSGSDIKGSEVCERLSTLGANISIGHKAANLPPSASLVVYSSAVTSSNPEMKEARRRKLPIVRRAEVLAELMRLKYGVAVAGSHGKTTTTSMCGVILERAGLDPTVVIGGQVKSMGTGGRHGRGEFLVAESDESDRSFLLLKPTVAIVTNIDDEHMNAYRSRKDLEDSFEKFVQSVPFYGLAVLCVDDPVVARIARGCKRRVVTYGFSEEADLRAIDLVPSRNGMEFTVLDKGVSLGRFHLAMFGRHLVQNSLAAIAVAREFGVSLDVIQQALSSFGGVKRRLEVIGTANDVVVMNDYGHHPTEVKATLRAIRECFSESARRIHVVFQPHRFTRTQLCWNEFLSSFHDADKLYVIDIYAASEDPIPGVSGELFAAALDHPDTSYIGGIEDAVGRVLPCVERGDLILCLGAGSVGSLPERFLAALSGPCVDSLIDASSSEGGVLEGSVPSLQVTL